MNILKIIIFFILQLRLKYYADKVVLFIDRYLKPSSKISTQESEYKGEYGSYTWRSCYFLGLIYINGCI